MQALDASAIFGKQVILFRLTRAKYASLSGIGAAKTPGRWNEAGVEALYTCCEAAGAVLELLAHTPKDMIPSNMAMMRIRLKGQWVADEHGLSDKSSGGRIRVLHTVLDAYRYFNTGGFSSELPFALVLPSVVAPMLNVVLYPAHKGFWDHIEMESVESFEFDQRLFPKDARTEELA